MGEHVINAELSGHAHGNNPVDGDLEFKCHWGDESIDELTVVTPSEAQDLIDDANTSQAAFNTTAGNVTTWYPSAFSGLSSSEETKAKATCRKACLLWFGLCGS